MSNQLQITGDLKVKSLTGALTATAGVVSSVPLGTANGVATLGSDGKVPSAQLPTMGSSYKGTWNAATNTPTIADGVGTAGDYYLVSVGGTWNGIVFLAGNTVIYSGTVWQKAGGGSGTVTSVGLAAPAAFSVSGSPVTSTGTLTLAGAGAATDYIKGDGTLSVFNTAAISAVSGTYLPLAGGTLTGNINYSVGNGVDWYINVLTSNGATFRLKSHAGETGYNNRSGALAWIDGVGTRADVLGWTDSSIIAYQALSGTSATFSNILTSSSADQSTSRIVITNTGTGGQSVSLVAGNPNTDQTGFSIAYGNTNFLRFNSAGAATFSSSVTAAQGIFPNATNPANTTYIGQSNTGAYLGTNASAKPLYFETSGTERMRITSGGNVLIGTTTDNGAKLNVSGSAIFSSSVQSTDFRYTANGFLTYDTDATGTNTMQIRSGFAGAVLSFNGTGNANFLYNVGIGTSSPNANLSLSGSGDIGMRIKASALSYIDFDNADSGTPNGSIAYNNSTNNMTFSTGGSNSEKMRITSGGLVGIGTDSPSFSSTGTGLNVQTASGDSAYLKVNYSSGNSAEFRTGLAIAGIGNVSNNPFQFFTNNTERARITSTGSLLIGTTTDAGASNKLQVDGNIYLSYGSVFNFNGSSAPNNILVRNTGSTFSIGGPTVILGLLTNYNEYNRQTSSYTLVLSDASKIIEMDTLGANTVTVPLDSSVAFPVGTEITVIQLGAGVTTFAFASGVTFRSNNFGTRIGDQYSGATLIKRGTNDWYIIGNILP